MKFSVILFVFQLLILDAAGSQYEDEFFRNLIDLENSMPTPTDKPSETTTSTPTVAPTVACESVGMYKSTIKLLYLRSKENETQLYISFFFLMYSHSSLFCTGV